MTTDALIEARRRYRRAWVAFGDFMETGMALNAYNNVRSCHPMELGGENDLQNTRYCLIGFAIVAYMRPFKKSHPHDRATRMVTWGELGITLDKEAQALHERIEQLRDKLIAHSDFSHKEVVPEKANVARAMSMPPIAQVQEIHHAAFYSLAALATTATSEYMGRLVKQYGDALMR